MVGSGPSRVIKFLYSHAPPPPTVWALDLPTIHPVKVTRGHKTTYAPMIYTSLCIMFWMRAYPLRGEATTSPRNDYARIQNIMHGAV
jgi:hypothetical protein